MSITIQRMVSLVSVRCTLFSLDSLTGMVCPAQNEDCGQMSAWYLFSAMGFYPGPTSDQRHRPKLIVS